MKFLPAPVLLLLPLLVAVDLASLGTTRLRQVAATDIVEYDDRLCGSSGIVHANVPPGSCVMFSKATQSVEVTGTACRVAVYTDDSCTTLKAYGVGAGCLGQVVTFEGPVKSATWFSSCTRRLLLEDATLVE